MKNNQDLVNPEDFGTSKREISSIKKVKPSLTRDVQRLVNWLDKHVLPMVALILIAGLAVKGLQVFLPEMSQTTQLVVSILGVSVLVVKLKAEYNR